LDKFHQPCKSALSVGSVMIDIMTVIANDDIELMTLHNMTSSFLMLEQGRKVESQSIDTYVGGGGANTAVCMSRLGMAMTILAMVGHDLNAEKILARLQQENIALDHMKIIDHIGSGVAVHISSHDRNAAIFTHRGANCCLSDDDIENINFNNYNLVYVTNLSNESADHFPVIIHRAAAAGCFIASNPGIRQLTRLCDDFINSLAAINLLSINKLESEALVPNLVSKYDKSLGATPKSLSGDLPDLLNTGFRFGGFSMGLIDFMTTLAAHGPDYIVITDGSKGAYLLHRNILYYSRSRTVTMRGSAGAGDGFSSTLASLIFAGNAPDIALYAATVNALSVISEVDTQTGLLTFEAIEKAIATGDIATEITRWKLK